MTPPPVQIHPPLINSANPWATTIQDLERLFLCPSTGAVTTRTSIITTAFPHDPSKHQYAFFNPTTHASTRPDPQPSIAVTDPSRTASLNTLGYSPLPLETYLSYIKEITTRHLSPPTPSSSSSPETISKLTNKPFIISVTGTPQQVADSYRLVSLVSSEVPVPLHVEINLSCPNIPDSPPPAYSKSALLEYLFEIRQAVSEGARVAYGLKVPPYTHSAQFRELIDALDEDAGDGESEVSFITATNTLGNCLVLDQEGKQVLPGEGLGGMAGSALHPLALGNVKCIRALLDERKGTLGHVSVIGVGGVMDLGGYRRMRKVGAEVVGVGTSLGVKGLSVFAEIEEGVDGVW